MAIKIRKRKLKTGDTSFYLDIYTGEDRKTETIPNVRLTTTTTAKQRKAVLEAVEAIRAKRQMEIYNDENGFKKNAKAKEDFVQYFVAKMDSKDGRTKVIWYNTLHYLNKYTKGKVRFKDINKDWIEGFIQLLQTNLAPNTVLTYFQKITSALNDAVKEEIIMENIMKLTHLLSWKLTQASSSKLTHP